MTWVEGSLQLSSGLSNYGTERHHPRRCVTWFKPTHPSFHNAVQDWIPIDLAISNFESHAHIGIGHAWTTGRATARFSTHPLACFGLFPCKLASESVTLYTAAHFSVFSVPRTRYLSCFILEFALNFSWSWEVGFFMRWNWNRSFAPLFVVPWRSIPISVLNIIICTGRVFLFPANENGNQYVCSCSCPTYDGIVV